MKYLIQFFILMCFVLAGEATRVLMGLPIPASIWGMIWLLLSMVTGLVKLKQIDGIADFFLLIIPVLLVAPTIGVIDVFGKISAIWPEILVVTIASTLITMTAVALFADKLAGGKR